MKMFEDIAEVAALIKKVDKAVNRMKKVDEADMTLNIRRLYTVNSWRPGPVPIPEESLPAMGLEDMTADKRWQKHFLGHKTHIGLYRSSVGFYWLLRHDPASKDNLLEHVGPAADVAERFG
jgi:hypothetical protein